MFALAHPGGAGLQCSCGPISHRSPGRRARLGVLSPHEEARKVRMWPGSSTCPLAHGKNGNRTHLQPCASTSHMPHWPHQSLGPQNFSISRTRQLLCSVNKVLGWDPLGLQEALQGPPVPTSCGRRPRTASVPVCPCHICNHHVVATCPSSKQCQPHGHGQCWSFWHTVPGNRPQPHRELRPDAEVWYQSPQK